MNTPTVAPWWERVSPELVEQYVQLVRETRITQRAYRRTQDPQMRRALPPLEDRVDQLTERLAAAIAASRQTAELVEGGAS